MLCSGGGWWPLLSAGGATPRALGPILSLEAIKDSPMNDEGAGESFTGTKKLRELRLKKMRLSSNQGVFQNWTTKKGTDWWRTKGVWYIKWPPTTTLSIFNERKWIFFFCLLGWPFLKHHYAVLSSLPAASYPTPSVISHSTYYPCSSLF